MPTATCRTCGEKNPWRNQRGVRLKDMRCTSCGGELQGATSGGPGSNTGRKIEKCVVCGHRAFIMLHPPDDYRVLYGVPGEAGGRSFGPSQQQFPAGSPCCPHTHFPVPVDYRPEVLRDAVTDEEMAAAFRYEKAVEEWAKGRSPAPSVPLPAESQPGGVSS